MMKRILSMILVVCMSVTILSVAATAESSGLHTSPEGLEKIKALEGFTQYAIADGAQWSIGYGNACGKDDYPNGITEEEASALLVASLATFEDYLNNFLMRNGLTVTQTQFDALISMTYNLGPTWLSTSNRFWGMMCNGLENYTSSQIASALGVWCHVGTSIHTGVLQRRISEIQLFLYGDYTGTTSPTFRYLIFDDNGGDVETDIYLYEEGSTYGEFPAVARDGYRLVGWFTEPEGGEEVTINDTALVNDTLYAQWASQDTGVGGYTYSDVSANQWFYPYVMELSSAGVIGGYTDGTFRPNNAVTVGETLKLVLLTAGYPPQAGDESHWASGYLSLALSNQIVSAAEVPELNATISRQLVAKVVCNALGLSPYEGASVFSDTQDQYVMALYNAGIIDGTVDANGNRLYYPQRSLTRAEMAKIIWAVSHRIGS